MPYIAAIYHVFYVSRKKYKCLYVLTKLVRSSCIKKILSTKECNVITLYKILDKYPSFMYYVLRKV